MKQGHAKRLQAAYFRAWRRLENARVLLTAARAVYEETQEYQEFHQISVRSPSQCAMTARDWMAEYARRKAIAEATTEKAAYDAARFEYYGVLREYSRLDKKIRSQARREAVCTP